MPKRPPKQAQSEEATHNKNAAEQTNHNSKNSTTTQAEEHEPEQEQDDITEESEKNARKLKEKKHDAGAADLERVTDYAEEAEISTSDISAMMGLIGEEVADRLAKEKELLKVKIKKEDVDLLVREFEIGQERAERSLREHKGNLMDTLKTLTT